MREQPDGAALLRIAQEILRKELLPLLPRGKTYTALMLLNAMGIAERQLQEGSESQEQERQALSMLLQQEGSLDTLMKAFAARIRAGDYDHDATARQLLWQATVQRVRESAPKALAAYGLA